MKTKEEITALVESVRPLVKRMARKHAAAFSASRREAEQTGLIEAAACAETYQPRPGCTFAAYVWPALLSAMRRETRRERNLIRLPLGAWRRGLAFTFESSHEPDGGGGQCDVLDSLPDERGPAMLRSDVEAVLSVLNDRHRRYVHLRFLAGFTAAESATEMGMSRARAYQVESAALASMRAALLRSPDYNLFRHRRTVAPAGLV